MFCSQEAGKVCHGLLLLRKGTLKYPARGTCLSGCGSEREAVPRCWWGAVRAVSEFLLFLLKAGDQPVALWEWDWGCGGHSRLLI